MLLSGDSPTFFYLQYCRKRNQTVRWLCFNFLLFSFFLSKFVFVRTYLLPNLAVRLQYCPGFKNEAGCETECGLKHEKGKIQFVNFNEVVRFRVGFFPQCFKVSGDCWRTGPSMAFEREGFLVRRWQQLDPYQWCSIISLIIQLAVQFALLWFCCSSCRAGAFSGFRKCLCNF